MRDAIAQYVTSVGRGCVEANLLSQLPGGSQDQSLSAFQLHINLLKDGNGKGGSLPSARLGLSNHIVT